MDYDKLPRTEFRCNRCGEKLSLNVHGYCKDCWASRPTGDPPRCPRCLNHRYVTHFFDVHCGGCGLREDAGDLR